MVLGCLERIHQLAQKSPHKEGTLQQTKSQKTEGERLFFSLRWTVVYSGWVQGTKWDGWMREGLMEKKGEREGWMGITQLVDAQTGCLWVIVQSGGRCTVKGGSVKDLLWRLRVNHLSGTRQFYGAHVVHWIPWEEWEVQQHTYTHLNLHVSYDAKPVTGWKEKQEDPPPSQTVSRPWPWW